VAEPLRKWATPAQVDELKALVGKEGINPAHVLDVLTAIAPEDAAQIAIDLMPSDKGLAKYALGRIGAPAETAIITSLGDPDPMVRTTCCEILLEIGTEASLKPLTALQDDEDPTTATEARRALEVIKRRLKG
jgi:HEAT repeat protein